MQSTIPDYEFHGRAPLFRDLHYRPSIKEHYLFALYLGAVSGALLFCQAMLDSRPEIQTFELASAAIIFAGTLQLLRIYKKLSEFSTVQVRADGVTLMGPEKNEEIGFQNVSRISFAGKLSRPCSFKIHMNNGDVFSFFDGLERPEYILDALAQANPRIAFGERYLFYRRRGIVDDHYRAIMADSFKTWRKSLAWFILPPLVGSIMLGFLNVAINSESGLWFALNSFLVLMPVHVYGGMFLYSLSSFALALQKSKALFINPFAVRRDLRRESKMRMLISSLHLAAFVAILLVASSWLLATNGTSLLAVFF